MLDRLAASRFWGKVDKSAGPSECWPWAAGKSCHGYGYFWFNGKMRRVHRIAYEITKGAISEGMVLDHLCRNRACCNPAHLEEVTSKENTLRGVSGSARNARKTHCVHGHEFTPENTHMRRSGYRACKICVAAASKKGTATKALVKALAKRQPTPGVYGPGQG